MRLLGVELMPAAVAPGVLVPGPARPRRRVPRARARASTTRGRRRRATGPRPRLRSSRSGSSRSTRRSSTAAWRSRRAGRDANYPPGFDCEETLPQLDWFLYYEAAELRRGPPRLPPGRSPSCSPWPARWSARRSSAPSGRPARSAPTCLFEPRRGRVFASKAGAVAIGMSRSRAGRAWRWSISVPGSPPRSGGRRARAVDVRDAADRRGRLEVMTPVSWLDLGAPRPARPGLRGGRRPRRLRAGDGVPEQPRRGRHGRRVRPGGRGPRPGGLVRRPSRGCCRAGWPHGSSAGTGDRELPGHLRVVGRASRRSPSSPRSTAASSSARLLVAGSPWRTRCSAAATSPDHQPGRVTRRRACSDLG